MGYFRPLCNSPTHKIVDLFHHLIIVYRNIPKKIKKKKIDRFRIQVINGKSFFSIFLGIFRYATIGLWKRSTILWMGELDSSRNYPKCGLLSKLQRIWHGLENPCFGRGPGTQFCTRQTLPKKSCFYGVSSDYLSTCIFLLLGFFSCSKCN